MSSIKDFSGFFQAATGKEPYDYQTRLATASLESRMISVPTGLGKTAAVVLAWLWNRMNQRDSKWPRRLVYCLPMRTLVEQTAGEAKKWITNLLAKAPDLGLSKEAIADLQWLADHSPVILMGGDDAADWDLHPERPAILIGTQDMLLSRALNRGYGMSRYRWPMHFGLLNNNSLWVLDETQLMGVGVETSAQLDGFRSRWLNDNPNPTWWMSATLEDSRLATVDHPTPPAGWPRFVLENPDREAVTHRLSAKKTLHKASLSITKQTKPSDLAQLVLEKHIVGQLTLVIVNRVQRAQELYEALQKAGRKENIALVHSRFRAADRKTHQDILLHGTGDRIAVATQAVEAGVDISARVLITELAPWASLVQRLGRCNRGGEFNADGADVYWIDLEFDKDADVAPYTLAELTDARIELEALEGTSVSPDALCAIQVTPPPVIRPVIRRKDLIDLFDTTPDIAGHDLDISRYIREGDDTDVQAFWRDLSSSDFLPTSETLDPARIELCRVAVHHFQAFIEKVKNAKDGRSAYVWDGLHDEWRPATKARAGAMYLLDHRTGGYDPSLGWTGKVAALKKPAEWTPALATHGKRSPDATSRDPLTMTGQPLSLEDHTSHVVHELRIILNALAVSAPHSEPLLTAAQWHDVGKSQEDFQTMLRATAGEKATDGILAKSGARGGSMPSWRRHFRHELASALAWLAHHGGEHDADLVAYVIAAHHGKVRLSIRSMPEEVPPQEKADVLIARGILHGDELPAIPGLTTQPTVLDLSYMRMGEGPRGPSWLSRAITLRDSHGPFRLAYLETLLRAADMRASAEEATANSHPLANAQPSIS